MKKHAELILRDSVERILEQKNELYVISGTSNGFAVHFLNRPLAYFFSYRSDKGWLMDIRLENIHLSEVPYDTTLEQEQLSSVVKQCNIRYVLYKHKPKNNLLQQMKEIDAFFYRYRELLKERKMQDTQLCYTFRPIGNLQPQITIDYNEQNVCWVISYSEFNRGEKILPPLENIYHESQQLIFELNKRNS